MAKSYFVTDSLNHDGVNYAIGEKVELDEKQAGSLLALGVISLETAAAADVIVPEGEEKLAAIKAAIAGLDANNAELFTKDGTPKTESISAVTGWPVTAAERNAAIAEPAAE